MTIHPPSSQKGATLIVVLLMLLLITIIGSMAIRVSTSSLKIATSSQINQLLRQSADTPFQIIRNLPANKLRVADNAIGALIVGNDINREYLFCYSPTVDKNFALTSKTTIISPYDGSGDLIAQDAVNVVSGGTTGFCNLKKDFGSKREATVTQVAVALSNDSDPDQERFQYYAEGTEISGNTVVSNIVSVPARLKVTTISMLPAFSTSNIDTVQANCFSTSKIRLANNVNYPTKKSIADCVRAYGIPVEVQTQEFILKTSLAEVTKPN